MSFLQIMDGARHHVCICAPSFHISKIAEGIVLKFGVELDPIATSFTQVTD